jgi:hypothetical protein
MIDAQNNENRARWVLQESELEAARWMPLDEFMANPFAQGVALFDRLRERCVRIRAVPMKRPSDLTHACTTSSGVSQICKLLPMHTGYGWTSLVYSAGICNTASSSSSLPIGIRWLNA